MVHLDLRYIEDNVYIQHELSQMCDCNYWNNDYTNRSSVVLIDNLGENIVKIQQKRCYNQTKT